MTFVDKISALKFRNPVHLVKTIGERLRQARLARGWTQDELAGRAGIALSTLKLMEAKGNGSLQRFARVAVALGLDGDLRELFARPAAAESIEALERMERKRAPRQKKGGEKTPK
ncbi:helix-turn-helix domain-containing protein [Luteolibacter soli]|uniref:Helix-turn-helix domain-containing protein n=1 Tax=Luteolibacter soli TaxID=3135280 RepID=A0ABU9ATB0_9BACT